MSVAKEAAALYAVTFIEQGMTVGLGTGTTALYAIKALGQKVKEGLQIKAVASSIASENAARKAGIDIIAFDSVSAIDVYIDGADEVDADHNLIKGGGGALLREKILAYNSHRFMVIADESKRVQQLGAFRLPVEVVSFAWSLTLRNIQKIGSKPALRVKNNAVFETDNGNLILDCDFGTIKDSAGLNAQLHSIPGVVETGLFPAVMVHQIVIGKDDGTTYVL